jgi:hypothetical protein
VRFSAARQRHLHGGLCITAFAPDKGESVNSLIANPPPGAPVPSILPPKDGFLFLDKAKFPASFAGDVDAKTAVFPRGSFSTKLAILSQHAGVSHAAVESIADVPNQSRDVALTEAVIACSRRRATSAASRVYRF